MTKLKGTDMPNIDQDLRTPLILTYDRYVVAHPEHHGGFLPCIHGVGGSPICGSLHRSDLTQGNWEPIGPALVAHLFAKEDPANRRIWFCQNCVAANSHPLFYRESVRA